MERAYKTDLLLNNIYNDLLLGTTQSELVEKIATDYWNIGKTYCSGAAKNLITKARKQLKEDFEVEQKNMREMALNRLLSLYKESLENKDRFTALNTLKEINKLTNLYEPTKLDVSLQGNIEIDFGFDE